MHYKPWKKKLDIFILHRCRFRFKYLLTCLSTWTILTLYFICGECSGVCEREKKGWKWLCIGENDKGVEAFYYNSRALLLCSLIYFIICRALFLSLSLLVSWGYYQMLMHAKHYIMHKWNIEDPHVKIFYRQGTVIYYFRAKKKIRI